MKTLRLLLCSLSFAAGCVPTVLAAAPLRLFELSVSRFVRDANGDGRVENGRLAANGNFILSHSTPSFSVDFVPAEWVGKNLIYTEAWHAFGELGPEARANFRLGNGGNPIAVRNLIYFHLEPSPVARLDVAPVINLSTRGRLTAGPVPSLIGGFVVEGEPGLTRRVLIRAIGPSLAAFGVTDAAPDPYVSLTKRTTTFSFNDNWGGRADADEIERVAAQVGAFPLARNSRDAVILAELTPGDYTASVVTEGTSAGGTALLEVYVLP